MPENDGSSTSPSENPITTTRVFTSEDLLPVVANTLTRLAIDGIGTILSLEDTQVEQMVGKALANARDEIANLTKAIDAYMINLQDNSQPNVPVIVVYDDDIRLDFGQAHDQQVRRMTLPMDAQGFERLIANSVIQSVFQSIATASLVSSISSGPILEARLKSLIDSTVNLQRLQSNHLKNPDTPLGVLVQGQDIYLQI